MNPPTANNWTFVQQIRKGLILTAALSLLLLLTGLIPHWKGLPPVRREEVRAVHSPAPVQVIPRIVTGELSIVRFVHRAVSVHGVVADQTYRLFAALVFLGFYSMRVLSSSRAVRVGLAAFSLLGAAGCLCDVISYWILGGVVDWIGVNGRSAFAPTDLCWCLAPGGILLVFVSGLFTFTDPPDSPSHQRFRPATQPAWRREQIVSLCINTRREYGTPRTISPGFVPTAKLDPSWSATRRSA
jgi:hypothetical protein